MIGGRMHYFLILSRDEQTKAIMRLSTSGMTDTTIAAATGLAVEQVRRILAEAREAQPA